MSILTSLGIIVLAMLIMAFLQLVPGVFSLLLHYTSGKYSKLKASDLSVFFILGAETFSVLILLFFYVVLSNSPTLYWIIGSPIFRWVMAGIIVALGVLILVLYFRRRSKTELFISRRLASCLKTKAMNIKTRSDAFALGFTAAIPELIFTLPLYLLVVIEIMQIGSTTINRSVMIILFAIISILPLLILHGASATGRTLADTLRFRTRNQLFFRIGLGIFYFLIAILIISGAFI